MILLYMSRAPRKGSLECQQRATGRCRRPCSRRRGTTGSISTRPWRRSWCRAPPSPTMPSPPRRWARSGRATACCIRGDGVVLTIGYLIAEAESVWLSLSDGRGVAGHVLAYDQETGLGLVQALARVDLPALPLGDSASAPVGRARRGRPAPAGGSARWRRASRPSRNSPATGNICSRRRSSRRRPIRSWGGSALIGPAGDLLGIGSLQLQRERRAAASARTST